MGHIQATGFWMTKKAKLVKYGLLYNWYAATDVREITADGWHVPTKAEYDTLIAYLGGTAVAGEKLMDDSLEFWVEPGTNESNFNARGTGKRVYDTGGFAGEDITGHIWTATQYSSFNVYALYLEEGVDAAQFTYLGGAGNKKNGLGIRPIKDTTILTHGQTGTYTGNDGKVYRTICIGTQEWLADNLAETKFRGGLTGIKYGALYNWYAATDARNITSSDDWCVPDHLEFKTLFDYLGGDDIAGGKLKEIGFIYWDSLNTGATNEVGFNARGAGIRYIYEDMAVFTGIKQLLVYWNSTDIPEGGRVSIIYSDIDVIATYDGTGGYVEHKASGASIRLFRPATAAEQLLPDGTACAPYQGNDLKLYRTVKIGTQVWLADNLCETKYRNGDLIPVVTDNGDWAALTTGAMCAYDNDWNNAYGDIIEGSDNIPEVTDNAAWAALTTAGMCAYENDWDNVYIN